MWKLLRGNKTENATNVKFDLLLFFCLLFWKRSLSKYCKFLVSAKKFVKNSDILKKKWFKSVQYHPGINLHRRHNVRKCKKLVSSLCKNGWKRDWFVLQIRVDRNGRIQFNWKISQYFGRQWTRWTNADHPISPLYYNIHRFNRKTISRQQFVVIATHLSTI